MLEGFFGFERVSYSVVIKLIEVRNPIILFEEIAESKVEERVGDTQIRRESFVWGRGDG